MIFLQIILHSAVHIYDFHIFIIFLKHIFIQIYLVFLSSCRESALSALAKILWITANQFSNYNLTNLKDYKIYNVHLLIVNSRTSMLDRLQ